MLWITGGGLVIALVMIVGLLALVLGQGLSTLWPRPLVLVETAGGRPLLGEVTRSERFRPGPDVVEALDGPARARAEAFTQTGDGQVRRRLFRSGNFDLTGRHYAWVSDFEVQREERPADALVLERTSWGRFYGFPVALRAGEETVAGDAGAIWRRYQDVHDEVRARWRARRRLESVEIGEVNHRLEKARLSARKAELDFGSGSAEHALALGRFAEVEQQVQREFDRIRAEIDAVDVKNAGYLLTMRTADGVEKDIELANIVRAYPANALDLFDKAGIYLDRWREFLLDEPREANSEGGVFPAIFGTVVMTLLMSLAVVPFGVMAALYLREYAREGMVVSAVRISINNLAGVPSIVFGVFGLGFFCYVIGASLDELLYAARLPNPTYGRGGILWASLTLALLTLPVVIVATEEALAAVPNSMREGSYACGAGKWQTLRRIVLPRAMPGVMTGIILAMARGAGEVAPLMLVGAVKLAPELPVDRVFPFVHPERSFMHLGFHIFDLGFQSQNSEAAKPMVFTTTLLLITMIFLLNALAVRLRNRLRRKFVANAF
jgi:phosphate transport system permease protein